jgi:ABC-2 type transport system ATP-binding protein
MPPPLAVETRELTKRYGDRAVVDRLNLRIPEGVAFGFLGPNGAGKSTALRMLCGMLRPTSGEARVVGLDPARELERLKMAIGFMPQSFGLYTYLTVAENLAFYGRLYLGHGRAARERAHELIALAGLGPYRDTLAEKLSGGWKQRLALACALIHRPKILFLDEPTAAVDPVSRRFFWDLLHDLNDAGATLFVTTHYMEEVERCHLVGLMSAGRLTTCGSPRELKAAVAGERDMVAVVAPDPERAFAALRGAPRLIDIYLYGDEVRLAWDPAEDGLARTRAALEAAGVRTERIERRGSSMEDVFVNAGERRAP